MEETFVEWILANQECIPISGDLIKENVAKILDHLHPGHELFEFSTVGWKHSSFATESSLSVVLVKVAP
jgi:hypothetical protein